MTYSEALQAVFYNPYFQFVWGACWGSFLNVVMYRYPLGKSVVFPPSACPSCATEIKAYDNIPVLGWFLLGGKCRACLQPFSVRYALIEALMGGLCAMACVLFPLQPLLGLSLGHAILAGLPALFLIVRHRKLPWYLAVAFLAAGGTFLFGFLGK